MAQPSFAHDIRLCTVNMEDTPELGGMLPGGGFVDPSLVVLWEGKLLDTCRGTQPPRRLEEIVGNLVALLGGNEAAVADLTARAQEELGQGNSGQARKALQRALRISETDALDAKAAGGAGSTQRRFGREQARVYCGLAQCALADGKPSAAQQILEMLKEAFPGNMTDSVVVNTLEEVNASIDISSEEEKQ